MNRTLSLLAHVAWATFFLLSSQSCSRSGAAPAAAPPSAPSARSSAPQDGTLLELADRFGSPESLWCEVGYKVKRKAGATTKELAIAVDKAPAGATIPVTVDGFVVGNLVTNTKGDAKLSLVENKEQLFPKGFTHPTPGSVVRVGDLIELRLKPVVWLTDLKASFTGPGKSNGKVTYKVEKVGDALTREFTVKVAGAPPKTALAVALDGVGVGDVQVDLEGQGRLRFSTKKPPLFPTAFPAEPKAGSQIRVGDLFTGPLMDEAAQATHQESQTANESRGAKRE